MPHIGAHAICKYRRTGLKCSITKVDHLSLSNDLCAVHNSDHNMSKEMHWSEVQHRAHSLGVNSCCFLMSKYLQWGGFQLMLSISVPAAGNQVGIKWDGIKWFSRLYTVNAVMQAGGPGLLALEQVCFCSAAVKCCTAGMTSAWRMTDMTSPWLHSWLISACW